MADRLDGSLLRGQGVRLEFLDASGIDARAALMSLSDERGYDDVVVFAANRSLAETGDAVLARDGCLNFFAGPVDKSFTAELNLYDIHYEGTHLVGTSGGSRSDMEESLELSAAGTLNPSMMVTHVGGLGAVPDALMSLDTFTGGRSSSTPSPTSSSLPSAISPCVPSRTPDSVLCRR